MTDKDFRYNMPDGSVLEAFQVTEKTRYQEDEWPEWMSARYLMTVDNTETGKREQWLKINDDESKIPSLGWIVKGGDGVIRAVDCMVMEEADKVVKEVKVVHPRADAGITDEALAKIHKIELPDDHVPEDPFRQEAARGDENVKHVSFEPPELGLPDNVTTLSQSAADRGLLMDCRGIYDLMRLGKQGEIERGIKRLKDALIERANWCSCPPGKCEGTVVDTWDCRENSPLAK